MKIRLSARCFVVAFAVGLLPIQPADAVIFFTVSPSTVSNTYAGYITLTVSGLTNGESVAMQKYLDANSNGVVDAADILVQQFQMTDGQAGMVIGGVTNINVPGDTDSTPGQITAQLNFQNGDITQQFIGKYAYRLSSPGGHFGPVTNIFTITNTAYAQGFNGNVVNNGTNVPNAAVILFVPLGNGVSPVAGAVANNSGAYSIKAPPGNYMPLAFKSNFLANIATSLQLTLAAGVTITTNLTLTNATQTISGKIADAANTSLGLPGLVVPASSQSNNWLVVAFADANGNFTLGTRPDVWKLDKDENGAGFYGYLVPQNKLKADSSTGSVAGLTVACPKATALFFGTVKDNLNNPLSGVDLYSSDNNGQYETDTRTDQNGYYTLGALCGATWQVQVSTDNNQAFANYIFSMPAINQNGGTNLTCGQSAQVNFSALPATNTISGWVHDGGGNPISNVQVYAYATINGANFQPQANTDASGNYSFNVGNGNWSVGVFCCGNCTNCYNCLPPSYQCPASQSVLIANNNGTANFVASQSGAAQRPVLSQPTRLGPGQVGAYLSGSIGYNYTILVSTNIALPMSSWTSVLVTNLSTSPIFLVDSNATNKQLYYRAFLGP